MLIERYRPFTLYFFKTVKTMFKLGRRKKIQPVDLKKELTIAMREERRILPYGDYAPNHYVIFLNEEDARRWAALKNKAIEQLKTSLQEQIDKEGYQLEGDISIEIQASADLEPGGVYVEAGLRVTRPHRQTNLPDEIWPATKKINGKLPSNPLAEETGVESQTVEMLSPRTIGADVNLIEQDKKETPKSEKSPPEDGEELLSVFPDVELINEPIEGEYLEDMTFFLPGMKPIAKLIVTKGEDAGREFDICCVRVVVGRSGKNADISLTDSSRCISRQQFEIAYDEGTFILTDLQNRMDLHVFANEDKAAPSVILNTKDKIRLGNAKVTLVEMEFVVLS